jgi:ubiquinone/menaquinone biosynthesis C-methylase UbiE
VDRETSKQSSLTSMKNFGKFKKYGQYKHDMFEKMNLDLVKNKRILDVGCGAGTDAEIFIKEYGLDVYAIDIYKDENIKNIKNIKFKKAGIYKIPFADNMFDYVFLHDVLHHIDEKNQNRENHIKALKELERVTKKDGYIYIVEGNRFNPLFYPHMVKMKGHDHWRQSYFIASIVSVFTNSSFKFFECHLYPEKYIKFWEIYEKFMEKFMPKSLLAYNFAIIKIT